VVSLELLTGRQSRIVDVVNLFVEAIPHDQRIGQRKPVRFHRMSFLYAFVYRWAHAQNIDDNYPIMVFANTFGKIVGHNWSRMGLGTPSQMTH
jgi:hypothetical protein